MTREIRKRIIRPATAEEKQRHRSIREQVEQELPELKEWLDAAAQRHRERVAVGTVLTAQECLSWKQSMTTPRSIRFRAGCGSSVKPWRDFWASKSRDNEVLNQFSNGLNPLRLATSDHDHRGHDRDRAGLAGWRRADGRRHLSGLNLPVIYVAQPYGGMDPAQMEGLLTNYYEYHFLYISGIHHVESKNIQGVALMKLFFHPGTNMAQAMAETINYVNRSRAFMPPGTVSPFVMRFDTGSVPVGYLVLSSETRTLAEIQDLALFRVRPMFATLARRLGAAAVRRQPADRSSSTSIPIGCAPITSRPRR